MSPREGQRVLVAELVAVGRGVGARPAFEPGRPTPVLRRSLGPSAIGDLALVRLRGKSAEVVERVGSADHLPAALNALLADAGCPTRYPEAAENEAAEWSETEGHDDADRRDLRDQEVVTIDPEGAKDHDDAIAVERVGGGYRLWVHIADVARIVPAGGAIDREAARRAASVYVPGTVVPMLPGRLSADLCSLRPERDRNAVTVEMALAADGEVTSRRFYRSLIRSESRLSYPDVDVALADGRDGMLGLAAQVAALLRERRMARGALQVASREPEFELRGGQVVAATLSSETPAHSLVEECMVAANEAVASHLLERRAPTVFRHHEDPSESAVRRLYDQLEELEVPLPAVSDGPLGPRACRDVIADVARAVAARVEAGHAAPEGVWPLVLRSLKRAHYATDSVQHSGLASPAYLHFTSPIRRYPDLLAHRALLDRLGVGPPGPSSAECGEVAWSATEREREADAVERRADDLCAAWYLERRLEEVGSGTAFDARVVGAIDAGLFVRFGEVFEGFLPARRLPDDHYGQHPLEIGIVGRRTGRRILLGEELSVRVVRVERMRGRVEVEPADAPRRPRGRPRGRRR